MRLYTTTALALVAAIVQSPALGAPAGTKPAEEAATPNPLAAPVLPNAPVAGLATVDEVKDKTFLHADLKPVLLKDYLAARAKGGSKPLPANLIRLNRGGKGKKTVGAKDATMSATTAAQSFRSGDATTAELPADIDALARALKHDPDLIYEFVRDNIEVTPVYGIQKGAWGALIDRTGSNFDQAELMVRLLRASGYQADYLLGVIQLSAAQVQSYFGISTSNTLAVRDFFSSGQTPSEFYFTGADATTPLDYALLQHMWVRVTIDGQTYDLDPSLKAHTVKPGIGIASAAGYSQATFLAGAKAGATVTATSARNLNRVNVRDGLAGYASNLIANIRPNTPAAGLDDIIGGKSITPNQKITAPPTRTVNLPVARYDYGGSIFTGEIPSDFRSIVQIAFNGVNVAFLADDFYGARLTVAPNANNEPQLIADGEVIATGTQLPIGFFEPLQVSIQHLAYTDINADQTVGRPIYGGETYAISYALGTASNRLAKVYRDQAVAASDAGATPGSEAVLGAELAALGADLHAQMGMSVHLTDRAANTNTQLHHTLGLITQHEGAPNVNFTMSNTVVQQDYDPYRARAAIISHTMHGSALESGVLEQTLKVPAVSTIHFVDKAVTDGETIYNATAANFDSEVVPNLTGCSSQEIAGLRTFIDANWRLVLPSNCRQVEGDWLGSGAMELSPDNTSIGMEISGGYNGGFSSRRGVQLDPSQVKQPRSDLKAVKKERGDPVDMATGGFTYAHDDLVVGRGPYPEALSLTRNYHSDAASFDGPLGRGWSFNHAMQVRPATAPYQGLGEDSPIDAAGSIVETMVAMDLLSDPQLPFDKLTIAMLGNRWWVDQLNDNAVKVSTDVGGSTFVKLPDGTYNSPPDNSSKLIKNADGTFTQSLADKTTYQFDAGGNVVARRQPNGVEVHFGYTDGKLTNVQNSFGRSLTLTYDGPRISSIQDGTGRSVSYGYDPAGNLASFTDATGKVTNFEYDRPGRISKFYLPANPTMPQVTNVYDSLGRISQQTDADGKLWQYFIAGARSELVSPLGNRAADYFDAEGRVIATLEDLNSPAASKGSWEPRATYFEFDGLGRLSKRTGNSGPMVQLTYDDASCNSAEKRCTNNIKVRRQVAAHSAVEAPTLPDETQSFTYEPQFNKVLTATNARGKVTNFAYDAAGNLTSIILPPAVDGGTLRPTTTIGYTSFAGAAGFPAVTLPTSVTKNIDAANSVTDSVTYDPANGLVPKTSVADSGALNLTTSFGYDAVGNLTTVDGARSDVSDVTTLAYDAERRLTGVTDALGKMTRTIYNPDGDITSVARQLGAQWVATCADRLLSGKITQLVGPANVSASDACPAAAAPNNVTTIAYDDDGRVLTNTVNLAALEGGNRTTQFEYTPSGDVISTSAAVGTALEQNTAHGVRRYTSVNSVMELYSARNTFSKTSARPSIWLQNNNHDRLEQIRFASPIGAYCGGATDGYGCEQYAYDAAGNLTKWTRRDDQALDFSYDNLDRVTQRSAPVSTDSVNYTYDLLGRLLTATYGGRKPGASVAYTYDKAGRVLSTTSGGRTISYQYDAAGNRIRTTWPDNAFFVTYEHDALNRVSAIKENGTTLLASYGYDDLSRRTSVTYGNGTSIGYGYDGQARLGSQSFDLAGAGADLTRTFSRDQAGAVTALTTSNSAYDWNGFYNVNRPYTTDPEERYLTSGSKSLTYDSRANLAGDGTWKFTYDVYNRLKTAVVKNAVSLTYAYDPLDRLSSRQSGHKSLTNYLYDGNQLIGEYDANGVLVRRYVPGPGLDDTVVAYDGIGAATKTWLYPDERGSITAAADASGNAVAAMSYGPFGEPNVNTGVPLRYTGQMLDPDSGLYYYKARWYSPYLGRFLSPDPALLVDGLQTYEYVDNDPVDFTDPFGLNKEKPEERCDESTTFALNTVGKGTQLLGDGIQLVGTGVAATGLGAVLGGEIFIGGKIVGGVGTAIKLGGAYCEGHFLSSAAGEVAGLAAGTGANKIVNKINKGPWIDEATKRFAKNPLGGPFRDLKAEGISKTIEHAVSNSVEAIGKLFQ